jgi:tRNA A-37 threonylcarbamoyl transferase component Bud32
MTIGSQNNSEWKNTQNQSNIWVISKWVEIERKWVKQNVDNIINNPNLSEEDIKKLTDAFEVIERLKWVDNIDTENLLTSEWIENLRKIIMEELDFAKPFTNWQEWEVYKIEIWEKEYIIAKKRYEKWWEKEFYFQKKAYKIANSWDTTIKIPKPIDFFLKNDDEYIIMEYVNGKTLYTMIWEQIVNQQLLKKARFLLNQTQNQFLKPRFDDFIFSYCEWTNNVNFINDTDCEEWVKEILDILYQAWFIKENPSVFERDPNKLHIKKYPVLEKIYNEYSKKIALFSSEQRQEISINIRKFLNDFHNAWYYHRDLWWNPRNIMFVNKNEWYETYIIDFGRWLETDEQRYDYTDGMTWWKYDRDWEIITRINRLKCLDEIKEDDGTYDLNFEDLAEKSKKVWLGFSAENISSNIEIYRNDNRKKRLVEMIDDYIERKDRTYRDFLYLNPKWTTEEMSSYRAKRSLFLLLITANNEQKEWLLNHITPYLSLRKNTQKYKIAKIVKDYLDILV